jgi:hypothetical protein
MFILIAVLGVREHGYAPITIYSLDGNKAVFTLEANETKKIVIDNTRYFITGGFENGSANGTIDELILSNKNGEIVTLTIDNFFDTEVGRWFAQQKEQ